MDWKKLAKALLFPPIAVMILLVPVATAFLVYSMVALETKSVGAIVSYVLSAYTLTVWCFKIPYLIRFFKTFNKENKYVKIWRDDHRLRVNASLYGTLIYNTAYAFLQLGMGLWHHSFWFGSLAAYYLSLAVMRFFLLRHTRKHQPGEKMLIELKKYRACGIVISPDESGAGADGVFYGVLEPHVSSSRDHHHCLGGLHLYLADGSDREHGEVPQV